MTHYIKNKTKSPLIVPGSIKAHDEADWKITGLGKSDQGVLKPGETVECGDAAGAEHFARVAGPNRVELTVK